MKIKIIFTFALVVSTLSGFACDICGCGVGSYYIGILPEYNKRFLGLRYQYKTLRTHLGPDGGITPITANETYQSAEIWGGWNIGQKFRVLAFVPYNFNRRSTQDDIGTKQGLGDIAVMGYYNVFNQRGGLGDKLLVQSLWVGAGIKVPTGKYEPTERLAISESPNNFQLGTASTDFTFNIAYDVRLNDLGLNTNFNYKVNTENKYAYRYGNKFTANVLAYYKFRIAHAVTVAPNAGLLYETAGQDVEGKKYTVDVSGGYSLSAVGGIEIAMKGLSIGANYQNVRAQKLAGGRAFAGNRLMLHMSVPF
ncbi:transporter [Pedobacter sandarakinus]|uniref:transporter n=1 Tax=Pedobacter sandarakinus TaxID=353156 RepID=UPI002245618C|nr:transporter [Pedobacter sandarakinus]MCX2574368.1 transporter [Pedobacter sandarakinus]